MKFLCVIIDGLPISATIVLTAEEVHLSELETFERIFLPCIALYASTNDLETAQFRRYLFIFFLNE